MSHQTIRGSASSSITSLFGSVTSAANVLTLNLDSVAQLSRAGNSKARYYAKAVEDNCASLDRLNRATARHQNAKALTDLKSEIAASLKDETYAQLYRESLEELAAD